VKKRFEPAGAEGVVSTTTVSIEGQRVPRQTEVGVGLDGLIGVAEFGEDVVVDPVGVGEDPLLIRDQDRGTFERVGNHVRLSFVDHQPNYNSNYCCC
jgi:hypothetical protein